MPKHSSMTSLTPTLPSNFNAPAALGALVADATGATDLELTEGVILTMLDTVELDKGVGMVVLWPPMVVMGTVPFMTRVAVACAVEVTTSTEPEDIMVAILFWRIGFVFASGGLKGGYLGEVWMRLGRRIWCKWCKWTLELLVKSVCSWSNKAAQNQRIRYNSEEKVLERVETRDAGPFLKAFPAPVLQDAGPIAYSRAGAPLAAGK